MNHRFPERIDRNRSCRRFHCKTRNCNSTTRSKTSRPTRTRTKTQTKTAKPKAMTLNPTSKCMYQQLFQVKIITCFFLPKIFLYFCSDSFRCDASIVLKYSLILKCSIFFIKNKSSEYNRETSNDLSEGKLVEEDF